MSRQQQGVLPRGGLGRRLAGGALTTFALKLGGTGLAFLLQVSVARALGGPERFGTYALALAWANVLVLLGKRGLDTASLRFLPELRGPSALGRRIAYKRASRRWVLGSSCALSALFALVVLALGAQLSAELRLALLTAGCCVPVLGSLQLGSSWLQADRRMLASQGPLLCLVPGLALLGVLLLFGPLGQEATPTRALLLYGGSAALALLVSRGLAGREQAKPSPVEPEALRQWRSVASSMLLTSGFGLVLAQADILMLGMLADPAGAGEYAAVSRLARLLSFPLLAVNAVVAPMISELYHSGRREELQRLLEQAVMGVVLISAPLLLAIGLRGDLVLALFGEEYTAGLPALRILLIGHTCNVLAGSVGFLLNMTGGHRTAARILGCSAALNIALNGILIPHLGTQGAALATATTTIAWNVSMYVAVRRRDGLRPSFF